MERSREAGGQAVYMIIGDMNVNDTVSNKCYIILVDKQVLWYLRTCRSLDIVGKVGPKVKYNIPSLILIHFFF